MLNDIPAMTDPLGRHWQQPADIREAPMDATHILLTKRQFDQLCEYNSSLPTGTYEGKCWKRENYKVVGDTGGFRMFRRTGEYSLGFYYEDPQLDKGMIGLGWRKILVIE